MPFTLPVAIPAPAVRSLAHSERICIWVRYLAVTVGFVMGGSNLLIWLMGAVPKVPFWPDMMVMRFNTALALTVASLSLACWTESASSLRTRLAQALGLVVALIGGLTAVQEIAGIELGIDQLLRSGELPGDQAEAFVIHPGRMSFNAALSLFYLGLGLASLHWCMPFGQRRICFAPALALLAALPATLAIVGYLLGIGRFKGILQSTTILLHTALSLLLLAAGVLAARPELPPMRRLLSPGADGVLLRWTLPGTLGLLLVLGWLIGRARDLGFVRPGEGTALMLYGGLVLLSGLLVFASGIVARQEMRARIASEALRQGQERSRAIIDSALDAVLMMDSAGLVVDWNPAAQRIFGWTREEAIGQPLAERIIPEELRAAHYRSLAHFLETGEGPVFGQRLEFPAVRQDGSKFPIELSINPLPGTDPAYFVGFIRDITARRAADEDLRSAKEAAESASRAKDHFVAALSHELRTPLTPVLLSAAALRNDERLPPDLREEMAMMERNIALEARLIDDLLDLTRITRGKLPLRAERCQVHSLLSHAIQIVRDEADAKSIGIRLHLEARRSQLTGDPARLQQVFWNLLKNAVKFTPAGGRITITTRDDQAGDRLIVEVTHTGLGFGPEAAERIFRPFEQAGREGDHRFGGLGLGLAIARAVVDLHGGAIRAGSPGTGQGATFTVELPGPTEPEPGVGSSHASGTAAGDETGPMRILVVEDHEPTLVILQRLLTRAGHQVITAGSVATGLAAAESNRFDVVLSDLGLPDGTGCGFDCRAP